MTFPRNRSLLITLLVPVVLTSLVACGPANAENGGEDSAAAPTARAVQAQESIRAVRTIEAARGTLTTARTTSVTIQPSQESMVAAGTSGQVASVVHREGSVVAEGDVVVRLDDENLQLQATQARTAVQSARVNLQKAERASSEGGQQAQSVLRTAQANLDLVRKQVTEGRQLLEAGAISANDLAGLDTQLAQAESSYQQAQFAVDQSGRAGGEDLELLRLQLQGAQTQLTQAERALSEANIKAPFAGEIAEMNTEVGEFVGAGSPVFKLVSTEGQLARFSVPVQDAARLQEQGLIDIRYNGLNYGAQIIRASPVPGQARQVDMTAEVYKSETRIPTGTTTQFSYEIELAEGVKLPSGAIQTSAGTSFVFRIDGDVVSRQNVSIVQEAGDAAVVGGLDAGDSVVFPVPSDLRDGVRVNVLSGGVG